MHHAHALEPLEARRLLSTDGFTIFGSGDPAAPEGTGYGFGASAPGVSINLTSKGTLQLTGSARRDQFELRKSGSDYLFTFGFTIGDAITVNTSGSSGPSGVIVLSAGGGSALTATFRFHTSAIKRFAVDGGAGNDSLAVASSIKVPVTGTNLESFTNISDAAVERPNPAAVPTAGKVGGSAQQWLDTFAAQKAEVISKQSNVAFLGDSHMERWPYYGKPEWNARYAPLKAIDLGISGETTNNLLYRIKHGLFAGHAPKLIVLMIGTNNLVPGIDNTDAEVARAIGTIVATLQKQMPATKILLFGVLPRTNAAITGRVENVNERIAGLDDRKNAHVVDGLAHFVTADGTLRPGFYLPDHGHLTRDGYRMLANLLDAGLAEKF